MNVLGVDGESIFIPLDALKSFCVSSSSEEKSADHSIMERLEIPPRKIEDWLLDEIRAKGRISKDDERLFSYRINLFRGEEKLSDTGKNLVFLLLSDGSVSLISDVESDPGQLNRESTERCDILGSSPPSSVLSSSRQNSSSLVNDVHFVVRVYQKVWSTGFAFCTMSPDGRLITAGNDN